MLALRYELVDARLSAAGFHWYEVSNWCRPGGQCRHNLGYWDGGQWWGLAWSARLRRRDSLVERQNPRTYAQLLAAGELPVAGFERLGAGELHTEDVLLGIRLRRGLALARLTEPERQRARVAIADGLLIAEGDRLVLTDRGRLLADAVVRSLLG